MTPTRRSTDKRALGLTIGGFLLLAASIAMRFFAVVGEATFIICIFAAGVMISHESVLSLARTFYRKPLDSTEPKS